MNRKQEIAVGARAGGNSDNGGNAGPFALNSNNGPSNSDTNIGAALVNLIYAAILLPIRKTSRLPGNGVLVA